MGRPHPHIFWVNQPHALPGISLGANSCIWVVCFEKYQSLVKMPHLAKLNVWKNPVDISMFGGLKLRKHQTQGYPLTSFLTERLLNVAFSANKKSSFTKPLQIMPNLRPDLCRRVLQLLWEKRSEIHFSAPFEFIKEWISRSTPHSFRKYKFHNFPKKKNKLEIVFSM